MMGVLTRQLAHASDFGSSDTPPKWWGEIFGKRMTSGVTVDHATAMNYSAVWAATRILAGTMSTLPRVLFRQQNGKKDHAHGHPTYKAFRHSPNPEQSGVTFWDQGLNFCINWGNMFAEIQRDVMGRAVRLWPIHPDRIPRQNIKRGADGELVYHVINNNDMGTTEIDRVDMFHVPGVMSQDGITGKGVIAVAAESIGMGLATEQHGASFFGKGARPSIVMTHPKQLSPEAADELRRSWNKTYRGPTDSNGVLVLEEGTTIDQLTISPEQSQFLQTRQFNVTEIARWYNVPVHTLKEMSKSSFNNIESESLSLVLYSLMPWLVKLEEECNRQLLSESDQDAGYFFKFMLQGLLRGDMKARAAFYKDMFYMGVFSINDILELEDRNPIGPEGDIRLVPSNMWTIEAAAKAGQEPEEGNAVDAVATEETEDSSANVQAEALNGGQITALNNMGQQIATDAMPADGMKAMMSGSFPDMDSSLIDAMVTDFAKAAEEHEDEPPVVVPEDEPEEEPDPVVIDELDDELGRRMVATEVVGDIQVKLREQKSLLKSLESATACIKQNAM